MPEKRPERCTPENLKFRPDMSQRRPLRNNSSLYSHDPLMSLRNRAAKHDKSSERTIRMTREAELAGSREGLLQNEANTPSRPSLEESYSSSSELDLDELKPLDATTKLRGGWSPLKGKYRKGKEEEKDEGRLPKPRRKGGLFRSRVCRLIASILFGAVLVLGASIGWVFKKSTLLSPQDGVRLP